MNCEAINELYSDYLEGAISGEQRAQFDAHLRGCPQCAADLKFFQAIITETRALDPAPVPANLRSNVRAALQQCAPWYERLLTLLLRPAYAMPLAGATACALVVAVTVSRTPEPARAPSAPKAVPPLFNANREEQTARDRGRLDTAKPSVSSSSSHLREKRVVAEHEDFRASKAPVPDPEEDKRKGSKAAIAYRQAPATDAYGLTPGSGANRAALNSVPLARLDKKAHEADRGRTSGEVRRRMDAPGKGEGLNRRVEVADAAAKPGGGFGGGSGGGGPAPVATGAEKSVLALGGLAAPAPPAAAPALAAGKSMSVDDRTRTVVRARTSESRKAGLAGGGEALSLAYAKPEVTRNEAASAASALKPTTESSRTAAAGMLNTSPAGGAGVGLQDKDEKRQQSEVMLRRELYLVLIATEGLPSPQVDNRAYFALGQIPAQNQRQARSSLTINALVRGAIEVNETPTFVAEVHCPIKLQEATIQVEAPHEVEFVSANSTAKGTVTIWSGTLMPNDVTRAQVRIRPLTNGRHAIAVVLHGDDNRIIARRLFALPVGTDAQRSTSASAPARAKK